MTDRVRFTDLIDGRYTVCVHPHLKSESVARPIACRQLDVHAGGPPAELALILPTH